MNLYQKPLSLYQKTMYSGVLTLALVALGACDKQPRKTIGEIGLPTPEVPAVSITTRDTPLPVVSIDTLVTDQKYIGTFVQVQGKVLSAVPSSTWNSHDASAILSGPEKWVACGVAPDTTEESGTWGSANFARNQNEVVALLLAAQKQNIQATVEGRYITKGLLIYSVEANGLKIVLRER